MHNKRINVRKCQLIWRRKYWALTEAYLNKNKSIFAHGILYSFKVFGKPKSYFREVKIQNLTTQFNGWAI